MTGYPGWRDFDPVAHERAVREQGNPSPAKRPRRKAQGSGLKAQGSKLEAALVGQIEWLKLPAPEREVELVEGRRFRWDLVWREQRLAVEIQGGTWSQGAHSRGKGQSRDARKAALATLGGWRCLYVTSDQVKSGEAAAWIEQALKEIVHRVAGRDFGGGIPACPTCRAAKPCGCGRDSEMDSRSGTGD